ncbi:EF-hand domain-containing protein [Novosphingobium kunmingense]|uniref:EF-hand domain-containing protein n=1 Tax=Novosphingobium kunmingense TaxID=1211806 RepID=UPI0018E26337|nr:EF-hand domain-containing protein [Novosphingobium kunmingense]
MAALFAAISLSASAPALAQPDQASALRQLQERFGDADGNRDGAVSRAEFVAYRAAQWSRLDRNDDGFLSPADLPGFLQSRWNGERASELRRNYDRDQDGRVSRQEFLTGPTPAFNRADTNGNDLVSRAELDAAVAQDLKR